MNKYKKCLEIKIYGLHNMNKNEIYSIANALRKEADILSNSLAAEYADNYRFRKHIKINNNNLLKIS